MSTGPSQPPSTPSPSPGHIEPHAAWEEKLYDTIEVSQRIVNDAKRHYEACLAAAADTGEGPSSLTREELEHYKAINSTYYLARESFHTQIFCERHELVWAMGHWGQENQTQLDTEPDEAWKGNLRKSIEQALLPLANDMETDYGTRFAAAGIEDGEKLSKEYVRNIKRLKRLADEWFEAQLDRERRVRTKIIELSKQAAREQGSAYLARDESPLSYSNRDSRPLDENIGQEGCRRTEWKEREQELWEREEEIKRKGQDFIRKDEAIQRKEEEIRQREDELWKREQEHKKSAEEAKQRESELMLKEKTLRRKEEEIRLREEATRLWEETLQEEIYRFKREREEALSEDESLAEDKRLKRAGRVEPRRREQELCQEVPSFGGQRDEAGRKEENCEQLNRLEGERREIRRREERLGEREEELDEIDITSYYD